MTIFSTQVTKQISKNVSPKEILENSCIKYYQYEDWLDSYFLKAHNYYNDNKGNCFIFNYEIKVDIFPKDKVRGKKTITVLKDKDGEYFEDEQENRSYIDYFRTEWQALRAIISLNSCSNCLNCKGLTYCVDCTFLHNRTDEIDCHNSLII